MDINKCIKEAIELIERPKSESAYRFNEYDSIYAFTNENIKDYYQYFNYDNSTLSITSSGDHMLHSVLGGSKRIVLFDINKLTKFYVELKVAAIKELKYADFIKYFFSLDFLHLPTLDYEIFSKFSKALPCQSFEFWNSLYEYKQSFTLNDLYNLFSLPAQIELCAYYDLQEYKRLSKLLLDVELEFIDCNLFDITKHVNEQFSTIFLSNVFSYLEKSARDNFFNFILNDLNKILDINGMIQYSYNYKYFNSQFMNYNGDGFFEIGNSEFNIGIYKKVLK